MNKIWIFTVAAVALFVAGCSNASNAENPAPKGDKPDSVNLTDSNNLTPEQQKLMESRGMSGEGGGDAATTEGGR